VFAFWSARLNWQLRVKVAISVATGGPELQALWQRVKQSASAADYMAPAAPGTERPDAYSNADTESGKHHFALLNARVLQMDWLELGPTDIDERASALTPGSGLFPEISSQKPCANKCLEK